MITGQSSAQVTVMNSAAGTSRGGPLRRRTAPVTTATVEAHHHPPALARDPPQIGQQPISSRQRLG
jgi:hypothetical protein